MFPKGLTPYTIQGKRNENPYRIYIFDPDLVSQMWLMLSKVKNRFVYQKSLKQTIKPGFWVKITPWKIVLPFYKMYGHPLTAFFSRGRNILLNFRWGICPICFETEGTYAPTAPHASVKKKKTINTFLRLENKCFENF